MNFYINNWLLSNVDQPYKNDIDNYISDYISYVVEY